MDMMTLIYLRTTRGLADRNPNLPPATMQRKCYRSFYVSWIVHSIHARRYKSARTRLLLCTLVVPERLHYLVVIAIAKLSDSPKATEQVAIANSPMITTGFRPITSAAYPQK